jgi:hypothetical protein
LSSAAVNALPELVFAVLPLVVLALVLAYLRKTGLHILSSPEWAFGSAVLFGQAIVRFVSGLIRSGRADNEMVALVVSLLLVLGLVPALIVLALVLHASEGSHSEMPHWLIMLQIFQFVGAIIVYLFFGGMGGLWLHSEAARQSNH